MYVVTYKGQFGFIKPWTAVRDGETFSQQFLTPSIEVFTTDYYSIFYR